MLEELYLPQRRRERYCFRRSDFSREFHQIATEVASTANPLSAFVLHRQRKTTRPDKTGACLLIRKITVKAAKDL